MVAPDLALHNNSVFGQDTTVLEIKSEETVYLPLIVR